MIAAAALDLTHDIGQAGEVIVRTHDGDIRVRAVDGTQVSVRASDDEAVDEAFRVEAVKGRLDIGPRDGIGLGFLAGLGRRGAGLDLDIPQDARIRLETASGSLYVNGMTGEQRYKTISGTIRLIDAGGSVAIEQVSGDVVLRGAGPVSLDVRTVSGALDLNAPVFERFEARMMSGDVLIAGSLAGPGPFSIESVSGDVTLSIDQALRIQGWFVSGSLRSELPHRSEGRAGRRTIEIGDGGPLLRMRAISGDLRVVAATGIERQTATHAAPPATTDSTASPSAPVVEPDEEAASAVASPNPRYDLRPATDPAQHAPDRAAATRPASQPAASVASTGDEADRLSILKDLESGHIDVGEAGRRLADLDTRTLPSTREGEAEAEFDRWAHRA